MKKSKIGLLTFSDGRKFAHELQLEMNQKFQDRLKKRLEEAGRNKVIIDPLKFQAAEQAKNYEVTPFYQIPVERYVVYCKLRKQAISPGKTISA